MNWAYADKYSILPLPERMKLEVLIKIAEQLERLNKNLENSEMKVKISGGVNTHAY